MEPISWELWWQVIVAMMVGTLCIVIIKGSDSGKKP